MVLKLHTISSVIGGMFRVKIVCTKSQNARLGLSGYFCKFFCVFSALAPECSAVDGSNFFHGNDNFFRCSGIILSSQKRAH